MKYPLITIEDSGIGIIDGDRGANYPNKSQIMNQGHCVFLNTGNIVNDVFNFSTVDFISEERDNLLRKGKLSRYDIVMTTRGTVGSIAYYNEDVPYSHIRINSGMVIVRGNEKFHNYFLYLLLKSSFFKAQISNFVSGSAQPQLPIRDIKKLKLIAPPKSVQKQISEIVGSLERKIELNRLMNETLKQLAMALYKHWFVNFGPFQDGEFVESELGMIPKGWHVKKLSEIVSTQYGYTESATAEQVGPHFLRITDIQDGFINWSAVPYCKIEKNNYEKYKLSPGDIVIARTGNSTGAVGYITSDVEAVFASFLVRLRAKSELIKHSYLYLFLISDRYKNHIYGAGSGSTRKNANAQVMTGISVVLPENDIMDKFDSIVMGLFTLINKNLEESQNLARIRDYLLPRLLSGEIEIKAAEAQIEEVLSSV